MQINPNQVASSLNGKGLPPIILLFGDEPQQKLEVIDLLRAKAIEQGFNERHQLTADSEFNWQQLIDAAQTMSLFSDKQYIELTLPTGKPGAAGSSALVDFAKQQNDDVMLVVQGPQVGKDVRNSKWFKQLSQSAWYIPCYDLKGPQLDKWISQYAQQIGLQLPNQLVSMVASMSEGNLLATRQELDKLLLLFGQTQITQESLQEALVEQSRYTVFELIDEVLLGNMNKAIKILQRLESEGVEPNVVLWSLINEQNRLQTCHEEKMANGKINFARLRIWPNKQKLYQSALQRLPLNAVCDMLTPMHEADSILKSESPAKPYVILAQLVMLFAPFPVNHLKLA